MRPHFGKMLWRWRPRFGLKLLFLVMTSVCVFLGTEVQRWRRESQALTSLRQQGAHAAIVSRFGERMQLDDARSPWLFDSIKAVHFDPVRRYADELADLRRLEVVGYGLDSLNDEDLEMLLDTQTKLPGVFVDLDSLAVDPDSQTWDEWEENENKLRRYQNRLRLTDPRRK
jgi:hypothetical protein